MVFRTRCTRATRAIVRHIVLHAAYHYKAPPSPPLLPPVRDIHEADDTSMWCGFFHDHTCVHTNRRDHALTDAFAASFSSCAAAASGRAFAAAEAASRCVSVDASTIPRAVPAQH